MWLGNTIYPGLQPLNIHNAPWQAKTASNCHKITTFHGVWGQWFKQFVIFTNILYLSCWLLFPVSFFKKYNISFNLPEKRGLHYVLCQRVCGNKKLCFWRICFLQILPDALKMNINILKKTRFCVFFSIPYSRRPLLTEHNDFFSKNGKNVIRRVWCV